MTAQELITYCTYFFNCTNIPIRYYDGDVLLYQSPSLSLENDPFIQFHDRLYHQPQLITYVVTDQFIYYGIVKDQTSPNNVLFIGPATDVTFTKDMLKQVILSANMSISLAPQLLERYNKFPTMTFERFLYTLCFIHYQVNQDTLSISDILDYKSQKILFPIASEHITKIYRSKEDQHFHNTYQFEKQYLSIIENGDIASLKKLMDAPIIITPGVVADNSIRQVKNLFIAGATLVTRAAIKGGLDMESAYQLSDIYIQKMEKLNTLESVFNLQYQMLFDYTERVLASRIPAGISLIIYECINFINANTNQPITVEDVAENVQKSRSFISRKFKEELGFGINEFITSRKIEEAKYLLTYTDKSISDVSFYLCFSSQSYFQNVFKKKLGITPNEYRTKHCVMNESL